MNLRDHILSYCTTLGVLRVIAIVAVALFCITVATIAVKGGEYRREFNACSGYTQNLENKVDSLTIELEKARRMEHTLTKWVQGQAEIINYKDSLLHSKR
jgi:hypothetical protein